ncbi:MAG: hypothetical protein R3321_14375 [Nitrososphaeraceae archaeon]|nr:hypothetical protein [Nitrososphaeraceae archaeon]
MGFNDKIIATENIGEDIIMADTIKLFYYRIFDDKEKLNYLKTSLTHDEVEHWLKEYEKTHQKYFNPEFITFLHEQDPEAELIEVHDISY